MSQIDSFGEYVTDRLEEWGSEFALHRDFECLGHQSKNMLQVLIDHKGELPPRNTGYKPLEVNQAAQLIEDIVTDIARDQRAIACVLRAMYCGSGRRKGERYETANLLICYTGGKAGSLSQYRNLHLLGVAQIRGALLGVARAA